MNEKCVVRWEWGLKIRIIFFKKKYKKYNFI